MSEFDRVAESYESIHNHNLKLFGESSDYFVGHKVGILKNFWQENGLPTNGQILDFGCGIGRSCVYLRERLPDVKYYGVDTSPDSIRIAKSRIDNDSFLLLADDQLPFSDESFDVVFAACVLHHIPPRVRERTYKEILRVLKPGGYFIVFEHNPYNPLTQHVVRTCEFDSDAVLIRPKEIHKGLQRVGFRSFQSKYAIFLPRFLRMKLPALESKLGWCPIGAQYWAYAQK